MDKYSRKRRRLTVSEKVEIVQRLQKGERNVALAREFGVAHTSIAHLNQRREYILHSARVLQECQGNQDRKRITSVEKSPLELATYRWYSQNLNLGIPIPGPKIREKALIFDQLLNGSSSSFKASEGWLNKFKMRHNIRMSVSKNDPTNMKSETISSFNESLQEYIREHNFDLDNVYNVDETCLAWKSLPQNRRKKEKPKDLITIVFCANATGTHKVPLLVIGERDNIETEKLTIEYKHHPDSWFTRLYFLDWFRKIFLPSVKTKHSQSLNVDERVLLILDNSSSHPPMDLMNSIDEKVTVIYIPPNTALISQPMKRGVIQNVKVTYKTKFLKRILLNGVNNDVSLEFFLNDWTLTKCLKILDKIWNKLEMELLTQAWKNLLEFGNEEVATEEAYKDVMAICKKLPNGKSFYEEDILQWLEEDNNLPTCVILKDEDIVKLACDPNLTIEDLGDGDDREEFKKVVSEIMYSYETKNKALVKEETDAETDDINIYDSFTDESDLEQKEVHTMQVSYDKSMDDGKKMSSTQVCSNSEVLKNNLEEPDSNFLLASKAIDSYKNFIKWAKTRSEYSDQHLKNLLEVEKIATDIVIKELTNSS